MSKTKKFTEESGEEITVIEASDGSYVHIDGLSEDVIDRIREATSSSDYPDENL